MDSARDSNDINIFMNEEIDPQPIIYDSFNDRKRVLVRTGEYTIEFTSNYDHLVLVTIFVDDVDTQVVNFVEPYDTVKINEMVINSKVHKLRFEDCRSIDAKEGDDVKNIGEIRIEVQINGR
jgi:hypothetical protein